MANPAPSLLNDQGHIDPPRIADAAIASFLDYLKVAAEAGRQTDTRETMRAAIICAVSDACNELSARKIAQLRSEVAA